LVFGSNSYPRRVPGVEKYFGRKKKWGQQRWGEISAAEACIRLDDVIFSAGLIGNVGKKIEDEKESYNWKISV